MIVIGRAEVEAHLDYVTCMTLMKRAMIALSSGRTRQLLRSILDLDGDRMFGVMPGAMDDGFGAKLLTIFPGQPHSHQGILAMFDPATGEPAAIIHAGAITEIRTAAATAAPPEALARPDARRVAILGTGEQALHHAGALAACREVDITVWGRDPAKAESLAAKVGGAAAETVEQAVADADIICTLTSASDPILLSRHVRDGTHINAVGSSRAGLSEIDPALVARARFFADHREGVLRQGAEFLDAKAAGLVGDDHVLGEIGEVFADTLSGRLTAFDVTLYKSLGSIVQDLACGAWLVARGIGRRVDFD